LDRAGRSLIDCVGLALHGHATTDVDWQAQTRFRPVPALNSDVGIKNNAVLACGVLSDSRATYNTALIIAHRCNEAITVGVYSDDWRRAGCADHRLTSCAFTWTLKYKFNVHG
jgi:hypothetical protein